MASPSHRSTHSTSLQTPAAQKQQRRMTSPAMSRSTSSLNLPEGSQQQQFARPPSPLRNTFLPDTSTGINPDGFSEDGSDDEDDRGHWHERSPSPSSSVSQLAASFAQRVGTFVGNITPRSPGGMPTDAELEAEAERERDRSRREAEAILTREAQQRRLVEERVLAMMESTKSLPPPPSRSQSSPNPPSPSGSQKDGTSWWTAAKNKLTPTKDKEPLTPAQQVIMDAKAREKKTGKVKEKEKEKDSQWPANPQVKYTDPAFANLNIPVAPPVRKPVPASPSSPTPSRPSISNMAPNLSPSPMRSADNISSSPSREAPPLYAQFNSQGTLDIHSTLLTIVKRFEKLEKWTVGHVRALEDRMSDVERWLVDKEKEKEKEGEKESKLMKEMSGSAELQHELREIKDEVSELQGRVGELGREMAKMVTSPTNLSSGPNTQTAAVSVAPQTTSSLAEHGHSPRAMSPLSVSTSPPGFSTPRLLRTASMTARESTSPPMASAKSKGSSGTRLPYPTGDYTSPGDTFSPTSSPPSSVTSARQRPQSIAGLPTTGNSSATSTSYSSTSYPSSSSLLSGIERATSPTGSTSGPRRTMSPTQGLPPPKSTAPRQTSVSPTPRKRYTVALGSPIVAPSELSSDVPAPIQRRSGTPVSFSRPQGSIDTAIFSSSPGALSGNDDDDDEHTFQDETIGKSAALRLGKQPDSSSMSGRDIGDYKSTSPSPSSNRRLRAQSTYGFSNIQPPQTPITPLRPRIRSKSTEKFGVDREKDSGSVSSGYSGTGKFIDPLVLRKQEKEGTGVKLAMPKPVGKVPIGQLVAFFDGDKKA